MSDQTNKNSVLPPWGLDAGSDNEPAYTGADVAKLFSGLFAKGKGNTVPKPGRLSGMALSVSGSRGVAVSDGTCLVPIGSNVGLCGLRETASFTPGAKHATYDRFDRVYLEVVDKAGSGRGGSLVYKEGTPAASPAAPSVPSGAVDLGIVKVPASGSISIAAQGATTSLNVPAGPVVKETRLTGSNFTGDLVVRQTGNHAVIIASNLKVSGVSSSGIWTLPISSGGNTVARSSRSVYGWFGYYDSAERNHHLFQVYVNASTIQIWGLPQGNSDKALSGQVEISAYL